MVFMATRDIKSGEQLFYSYCGLDQSVANRKAELAPYGIAQCTCASCVNATPETDAIRQTFSVRVKEYKDKSKVWDRLPTTSGRNVPVQTVDELLKYQKAVVKEGLDTHIDYWLDFIPALATAYRWAGRHREGGKVLEGMMRYAQFLQRKEDMRL